MSRGGGERHAITDARFGRAARGGPTLRSSTGPGAEIFPEVASLQKLKDDVYSAPPGTCLLGKGGAGGWDASDRSWHRWYR